VIVGWSAIHLPSHVAGSEPLRSSQLFDRGSD
jgi:hypothetical protein